MKLLKHKIKKFFPYESVFLQDRFLELEEEKEIESILTQIWNTVKSWKPIGFSENYCYPSLDNKITFEIENASRIFYIQYYDSKLIFGFEVMKRNYEPTTHYYRPWVEYERETEKLLKQINYDDSGFTSTQNCTIVTPINPCLPIMKIHWKEKLVILENIERKLIISIDDVQLIKANLNEFVEEIDYPENTDFIRGYFEN